MHAISVTNVCLKKGDSADDNEENNRMFDFPDTYHPI